MGHAAKAGDHLCDILDELEEAITLKQGIRVWLMDGSHKAGLPTDIYTENHRDLLRLEGHVPVPVTDIDRIEKIVL